MLKITFGLILFSNLLFANLYETLNDFAYDKTSNTQIQSQNATILTLFKNKQKCMQILITNDEILPFKFFSTCKEFKNNPMLQEFLNTDFKEVYFGNQKEITKELKQIQTTMQELMIAYKLKQEPKLSAELKPLNFNFKKGGILIQKVQNHDCILFEIFEKNDKKVMQIKGIENANKACKFVINSPEFKNLSYNFKDFNLYTLE